MPLYDFFCERCMRTEGVFRRIDARNSRYDCINCGRPMHRQEITTPMIAADYEGYESPVTGKWIQGRRAHIEDLKRSGCRLLEPGETEACARNAKKIKEESRKKVIDEVVTAVGRDLGLNVG